MSDRGGPIGIFDSGIGGLSVLQALRVELPQRDFIYIADSAHAPYGERDEAFVIARSRALATHLKHRGVEALVVACNTATAAAINVLRAEFSQLPIIGVEPALKPAAELSTTRRVGVMATRGTLASARFRQLFETMSAHAEYVLQPCDGLAEAIERAAFQPDSATDLIAACARHTRAMGRFGLKTGEMDTLVLGCTHYPFAADALQQLVGPEVRIIATGEAVARRTRRLLPDPASSCENPATGQVELLSTGHPSGLQTAARRWIDPASIATLLSLA